MKPYTRGAKNMGLPPRMFHAVATLNIAWRYKVLSGFFLKNKKTTRRLMERPLRVVILLHRLVADVAAIA